MLLLTLRGREFHMMLVLGGELMRRGASLQATRSTIEAHPIHGDVVYNSLVVNVGDMHATQVGDRAVVEERAATPVTPYKPNPAVPESIVHAAVESDVRTPVTAVPEIDAIGPTPISRGPQQSGRRRGHPGAR